MSHQTYKHITHIIRHLILLKVILLSSLMANSAAQIDLQKHLELARDALARLDRLATACLEAEGSNNSTASEDSCVKFTEALNGEVLNQYLTSCLAAKTWREQFVASQVENPDAIAPINADENLGSMINIEFLCGEDALLKRTASVTTAYEKYVQNNALASSAASALIRQLREMRQDDLISRERNLLFEDMQQQQQQRSQETQRQFQKLELELIRQENPPRYSR